MLPLFFSFLLFEFWSGCKETRLKKDSQSIFLEIPVSSRKERKKKKTIGHTIFYMIFAVLPRCQCLLLARSAHWMLLFASKFYWISYLRKLHSIHLFFFSSFCFGKNWVLQVLRSPAANKRKKRTSFPKLFSNFIAFVLLHCSSIRLKNIFPGKMKPSFWVQAAKETIECIVKMRKFAFLIHYFVRWKEVFACS